MKKLIYSLSAIMLMLQLSTAPAHDCVQEKEILGAHLLNFRTSSEQTAYVELEHARYFPLSEVLDKVQPFMKYNVQLVDHIHHHFHDLTENIKGFTEYNHNYLTYYTYPRLLDYLSEISGPLADAGYKLERIGQSIQGRNLYYIGPQNISYHKKTIIMLVRQHGDEGTANWIKEGFLNEFLQSKSVRNNFQLILYPMINPDGAQLKSRFNANGYDLNRSWDAEGGIDEIDIIHRHLRPMISRLSNVPVVLDMHGSIREDFFFRVDRSFHGDEFFDRQQSFIDELARFDQWQAGRYILSNGHPNMARIVFIREYDYNALTHETIRNIPRNNRHGRTKQSLFEQGEALIQTILNFD